MSGLAVYGTSSKTTLVTFLILMHSFHIGVGVLTTVVSGGVSEILLLHNYVSKKNLLLK